MKEVFFVSAQRSPIGKYLGSLKTVRVQDLAALTMKAVVDEARLDFGALDMCIYSQSLQSSLPANVGRHAWTLAGLSEEPAGYTLNTLCAGALQTMISGFNKLVGDEYSGVLVGGVDSYSMAQHYIFHPRYRIGPGELCFHNPKTEVETNAQPRERYGELTAAALADGIARRWGLDRKNLDMHVLQDRQKRLAALAAGEISPEIASATVKHKGKEDSVTADDPPESATLEELSGLPPVRESGSATRASLAPWADAAASLVMLSADRAEKLGCKPLARMAGFGIAAGSPLLLEKTTVRSINKALAMCNICMEDIDFFDIHSPSAAYALAVENTLGEAVSGRINVDGSSLSFGCPGAATGGVMAVRLISRLRGQRGRRGLINVGALGGQSLSVVIESV
ncbi:MAG: thiolase family protein [Syntrophobacterales bacterium]|nr:thiolase family protein [Syntrophobacterales bacterium]